MKGSKFFTVPYDARSTSEMRYLKLRCGGIAAFGRWMALLGILYEQDGSVDLSNDIMHRVIEEELELKGSALDEFIDALVELGWVEAGFWKDKKHVISASVVQQIEYKSKQAENAKGGKVKPSS